jgi:hypothetical protein
MHWAARNGHTDVCAWLREPTATAGTSCVVPAEDDGVPAETTAPAAEGTAAAAAAAAAAPAAPAASAAAAPAAPPPAAAAASVETSAPKVIVGVDVDACTTDGTVAFHWACWQGQFGTCRWLRDVGCDWRKVNDWGCNAVHWAALQGNLPMCQWLRRIGKACRLQTSHA